MERFSGITARDASISSIKYGNNFSKHRWDRKRRRGKASVVFPPVVELNT